MKRVFYLGFAFCFFVLFSARAQSGEEQQLAAAVLEFNKAMVEADRGVLEKITSDRLSYGHSSGKVEGKKDFVDAVVNGPFDFLTLDAAEQTIEVTGETAVVRHVFLAKGQNNGQPVEVKIGNLMIWQKQKGQWKLLARQAFKI